MINSVQPTGSTPPPSAAAPVNNANTAGSADRFLKLLVAQMQNQDPLSPMDNAQVTSQIAQINTVSGIEKLNTSVGGEVVVPGNALTVKDGVGTGTFELSSAADDVQVEILDKQNNVIEKFKLG